MDNLRAHHDARVSKICRNRGVEPMYQPPYSPDFNPIEPGWALQKQFVRSHAPRTSKDLVRVARRARYRVTLLHCKVTHQRRRVDKRPSDQMLSTHGIT